MYLYISHDVFYLHALFDGIHKKRSKPSEHLLLEAKGRLSKSLLDAFILTPFIVNGFMEGGLEKNLSS